MQSGSSFERPGPRLNTVGRPLRNCCPTIPGATPHRDCLIGLARHEYGRCPISQSSRHSFFFPSPPLPSPLLQDKHLDCMSDQRHARRQVSPRRSLTVVPTGELSLIAAFARSGRARIGPAMLVAKLSTPVRYWSAASHAAAVPARARRAPSMRLHWRVTSHVHAMTHRLRDRVTVLPDEPMHRAGG